jgi:hypothetical protein
MTSVSLQRPLLSCKTYTGLLLSAGNNSTDTVIYLRAVKGVRENCGIAGPLDSAMHPIQMKHRRIQL